MKTKKLENNGFTKFNRTSAGGMRYKLYSRDDIRVIKDQIAVTAAEQIFFVCEETDAHSHPMNAAVGIKDCRAAKRTNKTFRNAAVSWKRILQAGEQSVIGRAHFFSDKSQIFLSAGAAHYIVCLQRW